MATRKNIFESAVRKKLRFDSIRGPLSVESLWDLPLATGEVNLNDIAKVVNKALKDSGEEDFVKKVSPANTLLKLRLDILKHIINVKIEEAEAADQRATNKAKKERIAELIAKKADDAMEELSEEELQELHDSL